MPPTPGPTTPPVNEAEHEGGAVDISHDGAYTQPASAEFVADNFGAYVRAWARRVRSGESGVLPVLVGLVVIIIIFQSQRSVFLSAGNITNLLVQGATFILLGMAEVFVLLLGEIDLSIGYAGGVGAVITVALAAPPHNQPWWIAILAGLAATSLIGAFQGLLITRLRLPSFVVTLAGLLGFQGLLIYATDKFAGKSSGGTISITNTVLNNLVNGNMPPAAGWITMAVVVAVYGIYSLLRDRRRHTAGLTTAPLTLTILKIAAMAAAGIILVAVCNTNRGRGLIDLRGVPWVVPIVLAVLVVWTFLLQRTRFGRYVYAIGGNAEAARRAGISLVRIRVLAFTLAGLTAGIAMILYASRLGSISNNIDGGQLVLYAVAAAVIGGTSLFGGRGRMVHAVLGGLVIATIYNGMGLVGLSAALQLMVTALVLLAAVTVDAVARRGRQAVGT